MDSSIKTTDLELTLKKIFGFSSFRPNQQEIINHILSSRDVCAIMPTGGGKSLCYQLPAYAMPGTCVVVSPLISLMKDQVDGALNNGISAAFLNSSLDRLELEQVYTMLRQGGIDLLYVAPERFAMDAFLSALDKVRINLFAVDEAHCISEWGHDFRPDYLNLSLIKKRYGQVPVAAFTATATTSVQQHIVSKLQLRQPYIVRASFDRPNLFLQVLVKDNINQQILSEIRQLRGKAGIVYRMTRNAVEETADYLQTKGISCLPYHAGLSAVVRNQNQTAFNQDKIQVIVATIAFGMGIDKSNIRFIIHGDLPKNLENYYQEIGRAGRDGDEAACSLFFKSNDIFRIKYFIDQQEPGPEKKLSEQKLDRMVEYAQGNKCRRRLLLSYFAEKNIQENCGNCDHCCGRKDFIDVTREAQMILSAAYWLKESFGAEYLIDVVMGANTQKIRQHNHQQLKTYGAGNHKDRHFWKYLVERMLLKGLIAKSEGDRATITIQSTGEDVLRGKKSVDIVTIKDIVKPRDNKQQYAHLLVKLKALRKQIASLNGIPPYIVFSDKTLLDMCQILPTNRQQMLMVQGVGETKYANYGQDFIALIREHLAGEMK